ncbi:MAG: hypothetical protein RML12_01840 [Xanthomonadales bacterium]|nr:hypothetical protein [Xanthomonadales bacterium]
MVGLIEVGNLTVVQRVANAINLNQYGHCPSNPQYSAHFTPPTFAGMGLGYLIARYPVAPGQPRVTGTPQPIGDTVPFATPLVPPTVAALFDRPPFLLEATIRQDNGASFPITILLNHLRSLSGIADPSAPAPGSQTQQEGWPTNGHRVREKRVQAAAWLSGWIQNRQQSFPTVPIVVMGDLNAFEFSDGYVDVVGIIAGQPAPASQVLLPASQIASAPPVVPVNPPLANLVDALPGAQRYSFNFAGNAQTLDHMLVSAATFAAVDTLEAAFARIDSDYAGLELRRARLGPSGGGSRSDRRLLRSARLPLGGSRGDRQRGGEPGAAERGGPVPGAGQQSRPERGEQRPARPDAGRTVRRLLGERQPTRRLELLRLCAAGREPGRELPACELAGRQRELRGHRPAGGDPGRRHHHPHRHHRQRDRGPDSGGQHGQRGGAAPGGSRVRQWLRMILEAIGARRV